MFFDAENFIMVQQYLILLFSKDSVITKMKHFMRKGFQSNGHKGNVSEAWQPAPTIPAGFMISEYLYKIFKTDRN